MSNELIIASTQLPDYLREGGLGYEDAGVGAGIAPRAPSLGITTAKQFTISKDGQTMILPPDEKGVNRVRGILIAGAQNITKAWYAKSYIQGTKEAPDCFSNDSKTPAPGVKMPQSQNCASCPKNAFGSHPVTGRGKACGDRKMVIFVWEGLPNEMLTFNVPTMSMQNLRKFDTELSNSNIPMQAVIVDLTFDPSILYPVVKISAVGFVAKETAMHWIAKSKTQEISDLLREVDFDDFEAGSAQAGSGNDISQHALVDPVRGAATVRAGTNGVGQVGEQTPMAEQVSDSQPARRRRRTKAQIEADNAAAAAASQAGGNQGAGTGTQGDAQVQAAASSVQETVADLLQSTATETPEQARIRELQEQLAALQKPKEPEETPEQRQIRELQEQLAKAQQTIAQPTVQATKEPAPQPEMPAGGIGGDSVMDLINTWKNK